MKRLLVVVLTMTLVAVLTSMASAGIVGSKHDLSMNSVNGIADKSTNEGQVCIFCHTPHGATSQGPLWNRDASTATYTPYWSGSLNATVAVPDATAGTGLATGSSPDLCLSCHDGTVALNALVNQSANDTDPVMGTGQEVTDGKLAEDRVANLGIDLSNDHPVNFEYNDALVSADGALVSPDSLNDCVVTGIPLFNGKMQCSSCHNVHEPGSGETYPFLRASSKGSQLCLKCHVK